MMWLLLVSFHVVQAELIGFRPSRAAWPPPSPDARLHLGSDLRVKLGNHGKISVQLAWEWMSKPCLSTFFFSFLYSCQSADETAGGKIPLIHKLGDRFAGGKCRGSRRMGHSSSPSGLIVLWLVLVRRRTDATQRDVATHAQGTEGRVSLSILH